jgi:hypothetical protein
MISAWDILGRGSLSGKSPHQNVNCSFLSIWKNYSAGNREADKQSKVLYDSLEKQLTPWEP